VATHSLQFGNLTLQRRQAFVSKNAPGRHFWQVRVVATKVQLAQPGMGLSHFFTKPAASLKKPS
jgi:hypothetical protein